MDRVRAGGLRTSTFLQVHIQKAKNEQQKWIRPET